MSMIMHFIYFLNFIAFLVDINFLYFESVFFSKIVFVFKLYIRKNVYIKKEKKNKVLFVCTGKKILLLGALLLGTIRGSPIEH